MEEVIIEVGRKRSSRLAVQEAERDRLRAEAAAKAEEDAKLDRSRRQDARERLIVSDRERREKEREERKAERELQELMELQAAEQKVFIPKKFFSHQLTYYRRSSRQRRRAPRPNVLVTLVLTPTMRVRVMADLCAEPGRLPHSRQWFLILKNGNSLARFVGGRAGTLYVQNLLALRPSDVQIRMMARS